MSRQQIDPANCATIWFARLEKAKTENDFESAAEAVRQLRRLGVKVTFCKPELEAASC